MVLYVNTRNFKQFLQNMNTIFRRMHKNPQESSQLFHSKSNEIEKKQHLNQFEYF